MGSQDLSSQLSSSGLFLAYYMASRTPPSEPHKNYLSTDMFGMAFASKLVAGQGPVNLARRPRFSDISGPDANFQCATPAIRPHQRRYRGPATIITELYPPTHNSRSVYQMAGSDSAKSNGHRDMCTSINLPLDRSFGCTVGHDFRQGLTVHV